MTLSSPQSQFAGVLCRPMQAFRDGRGWLCELFRLDELPGELHPAMGYISETSPGVTRGPHEHVDQTDYFCFLGSFRIDLWDNRPQTPTCGAHEVIKLEANQWLQVVIPPGVVHAYTNVGPAPALVLNFPNRLYKGHGRRASVDEIRHENDPHSRYRIEM